MQSARKLNQELFEAFNGLYPENGGACSGEYRERSKVPRCEAKTYKTIAVVIPSYNNEKWCIGNLESVLMQDYPAEFVKIIIANDCSSDRTRELLEDYIETHSLQNRVLLINNEERRYSLANLHHMICGFCEPTDIVFDLDGDDRVLHEHVFDFINRMYQDPAVWTTYGRFITYPRKERGKTYEIPREWIAENTVRQYRAFPMHPRTFYAKLFHLIDTEDFLWDGEFFKSGGDTAFMFPMLEMAGHHARFTNEFLYEYNMGSSLNNFRVCGSMQQESSDETRRRKPYQPLQKLFEGA